jgi:phage major head subunit gpT-like protein
MLQVTQAALVALNTTLIKTFRGVYKDAPSWADKLSMEIPSTTAVNTYAWLERMIKMRKWVGPRVVQNMSTNMVQVVNDDYEATTSVKRNDIEDDQLGFYSSIQSDFARAAALWPEQILKTLLLTGTTTTTFDGVPFFSASHPINPAGVQSNNFTSTALTAANVMAVRSAMRSITGFDGEPLGVNPRTLIVPPQLEGEAIVIAKSETLPYTIGSSFAGAKNPLTGLLDDVIVIDQLTAATTWYLADTTNAVKPLGMQMRKRPDSPVALFNPTDPTVFFLKEYYWGIDGRGAAFFGPWWLMARAIA